MERSLASIVMSNKIVIPGQSLNLLRQMLNVSGWCKTPTDVWRAGNLLVNILPEFDVSWVKTPAELAAMTDGGREAYKKFDNEQAAAMITFEVDDKSKELVRQCLEKLSGQVVPDKYIFRLYDVFGFTP